MTALSIPTVRVYLSCFISSGSFSSNYGQRDRLFALISVMIISLWDTNETRLKQSRSRINDV